jgi:hypothetical protein
MRRTAIALLFSGLAVSIPIQGQRLEPTIFVDCSAAPWGDGSRRAPLPTITAAMSVAHALGGAVPQIKIDVATGICNDETLPIRLDVPGVWLKGARSPIAHDDQRPDGQQHYDTLLMAAPPHSAVTFFVIAAPGVRISHLSIDGELSPGPDGDRPPRLTPLAVSAVGVDEFVLDHLRIQRVGQAIRSEASSGRIFNNYLLGDAPFSISGGSPMAPPRVIATNNTILYRTAGIGVAASGPFGTFLRATFTDNDVVTSYTNSGPSNPAAIRLAPFFSGTPDVRPTLDIVINGNFIGGSAKYGIIVHAGQNTRRSDGRSYTGDVKARFENNVIGGAVLHPALITFTNARATELPCELNPTLPPGPTCPSVPNPPVYWEYLTNARFDLQHTGELDAALIDHPELQPVDRYPLHNVLSINGGPIGYQTFVVVPGL